MVLEEDVVLIKQTNMESYGKFKKDAIPRLLDGLGHLGVELNVEQQSAYSVLLESELDKAKVYANLGGHKGTKSKYRLVVNGENTIVGYHPIEMDGVLRWVHISQVILPDGKLRYFTNGVRQNVQS